MGSGFNGLLHTLNLAERISLADYIVNNDDPCVGEMRIGFRTPMSINLDVNSAHDLHLLVLKLASSAQIASRLGIEGNQLLLAANSQTLEDTGVDVLRELGHLLRVPDGERFFTPTQLGKAHGLSARKVNLALADQGFQERTDAGWQALPKGKPFAVLCDVNKRHGGRTTVQQLKWKGTVLDHMILRRA